MFVVVPLVRRQKVADVAVRPLKLLHALARPTLRCAVCRFCMHHWICLVRMQALQLFLQIIHLFVCFLLVRRHAALGVGVLPGVILGGRPELLKIVLVLTEKLLRVATIVHSVFIKH